MMKRSIVLGFSLIMISTLAQAEAPFWERLSFGVASYPEQGGNVTEGHVSYEVNPDWTAAVRMKSVRSSNSAPIPGLDDSLNLSYSGSTEYFVYPVEYRIASPLGGRLYLGGGLYVSVQDEREIGYFDSNGINSYDNKRAGTFYGPALDLSADLEFGKVSLWIQSTIVPFFLFSSTQEFDIQPLVPNAGSNSYRGSGFPYISLKLQPTLFRFLAPDIGYELQRFTFEYLDIDSSVSPYVWKTVESSFLVHTLTVRGSLRIPLRSIGSAEIGYGRKISWTIPEGQDAVVANKGSFKLTLSIDR